MKHFVSVSALLVLLGANPQHALAQARSLVQEERPVSVFVVDVAGNGLTLTSAKDGVLFDLDRKGARTRVGWTAPNSDDAFVVLDVNRNGRIDDGSEMLGDGWRLASGARVDSSLQALLVVQGFPPDAGERPGPRGIAWIDRDDAVFARLPANNLLQMDRGTRHERSAR